MHLHRGAYVGISNAISSAVSQLYPNPHLGTNGAHPLISCSSPAPESINPLATRLAGSTGASALESVAAFLSALGGGGCGGVPGLRAVLCSEVELT